MTTGIVIDQLMTCPHCATLAGVTLNVTTDTDAAMITGGMISTTQVCAGCLSVMGFMVPVKGIE